MSQLEIILPFSIPPASLAKALIKQMTMPSLSTLLIYADQSPRRQFDEFARYLPHEYWGHKTAYDSGQIQIDSSPPFSHQRMRDFGILTTEGYWFSLSPVHIHIARDHLVMTDQRRLEISDIEAKDLFLAAQEICAELGHELIYGDAKTWFLRADTWYDLRTASLDAAAGHNMEIWLAQGEHARAWRKLQNEIQMLWHIHPINQKRESLGMKTINSVWIHSPSKQLLDYPYRHLSLNELFSKDAGSRQYFIDNSLLEPALNSDWGSWLLAYAELEKGLFSILLQALQTRQISSLKLILTDGHRLQELSCRKPRTWQFWKKPNLQTLLELASDT
ncbi:hypothetical protein [Undibacterium fentianense]|uniref:Uncharacterized protein n=1 Tax=Undibacterium fentianense TaxID=2828728 RepID=A0A941IDM1_9BURK|nr:hypothetical protein [Undibacterium fentianense]MBR7798527.1 hypothetical protein [Undibacterium fentianense]